MRTSHLRKIQRSGSAGATVTRLPLPRQRTGGLPLALSGEVLDASTREPVAGARASLAEPLDLFFRLAPHAPAPSRGGLADAEGRFEVAAPADTACYLLVHHPRYLPELVEVRPGRREVSVALQRPGAIQGRLLDGAGLPLAGVRVRGFCPSAVDVAEARTCADGTFRLDGLRPGEWMVGPDGASAGGVAAAVVELAAGQTAVAHLRHGQAPLRPVG